MRRLTIKKPKLALVIHRHAVGTERLVYLAVANKLIKYPEGKSKIVYIGTTEKGVFRVAFSAAEKAKKMLSSHGMRHLNLHIVSCQEKPGVKTWEKLERALLIRFREIYGEVPEYNSAGKGMQWKDELKYFTEDRLASILE